MPGNLNFACKSTAGSASHMHTLSHCQPTCGEGTAGEDDITGSSLPTFSAFIKASGKWGMPSLLLCLTFSELDLTLRWRSAGVAYHCRHFYQAEKASHSRKKNTTFALQAHTTATIFWEGGGRGEGRREEGRKEGAWHQNRHRPGRILLGSEPALCILPVSGQLGGDFYTPHCRGSQ